MIDRTHSMVTAPFKKNQRFSTDQVVEMCNRGLPEESKISRTIVNKWVQSGLLARQKDDATGDVSYSFLELVKAKVAASLRASKKAEGTGKERTGKAIRLAVERLGKLLARAERASGENGRSKYSDITIFNEGVRAGFETDGYR